MRVGRGGGGEERDREGYREGEGKERERYGMEGLCDFDREIVSGRWGETAGERER